MKNLLTDKWLIPIAFAIIYIVWGSTYLGNWYAIQDIPPFLMAGSRFLTAGLILFAASFFFGAEKPTLEHWKNAAFTGILFLTIGTGGIVWAEQFVSSGIAALIVALQPLLIVFLMWQMDGKTPTLRTLGGTFLGMVGTFFLVGQDQFMSNKETMLGIGVILVSIFAWGFASMKVSKMSRPSSKAQGAGMQMISGGAVLLALSLLASEPTGFDISTVTARGAWSWVYLVVFGSIIGFSAFNYLLVKAAPDKVATSNYVNPIVALFLGWLLNSEALTSQSLLAAGLMLLGVVLINSRQRVTKSAKVQGPLPFSGIVEMHEDAIKEIDIQPVTSGEKKVDNFIARIWHGTTPSEKADEYVEWTKQKVLPSFSAVPGHLGLTFFRQNEKGLAHWTMISYWKDFEAIRQYAGENFKLAKCLPNEENFLLDFDREVEHRQMVIGDL